MARGSRTEDSEVAPSGAEARRARARLRRGGDSARVRPTARGAVLLLIGLLLLVAAYWERQAVLLVPAALCLGVLLLGLWWALGAVGAVRLGVPGVVQEGEDASLRVAGDRRHAGATWSTWAPGPERYLLLEGELDDEGRAAVDLGAHPRGRWRLAPVAIVALDPFRVMRSTRTVDARASLVVGPEVLSLSSTTLRSNREEGRLAQSRTADSVDAMVREWRPGDPQRRVHWRQSAKRGQLMVRQEANPATDDDVVVLDTASAVGADREAQDRLARAACSLVRALAGGDRRVVVRETGEPSMPAADWRDLPATLAAFASLEARAAAQSPGRRDAPVAHLIALAEHAPETWTLPPGTTLWLVSARDASLLRVPPGSRVRIRRWIDRVGPVRELA
ncbi:DUF58 domain-containing protein [Agrococcus sp. Marseille-P2731]|uniref:DUF58 domain-containing protein n=1 Tax=Agrococcus sp. Marseille-P2731 TaxID=1841862 RepID=UPI00093139EE|nr:DUF58 domain-containing protein [Agrococcus sp. Marseille-P2731]